MIRFILRFFKRETIWRELIRREGFSLSELAESQNIWGSVFSRTPELKDYLKRREVLLLKNLSLGDKPSDFVLGQIFENRMWQKFDTPAKAEMKGRTDDTVKRLPTLEHFLGGWNKDGESTPVQAKEGQSGEVEG